MLCKVVVLLPDGLEPERTAQAGPGARGRDHSPALPQAAASGLLQNNLPVVKHLCWFPQCLWQPLSQPARKSKNTISCCR